jgi:hypothetical protein
MTILRLRLNAMLWFDVEPFDKSVITDSSVMEQFPLIETRENKYAYII